MGLWQTQVDVEGAWLPAARRLGEPRSFSLTQVKSLEQARLLTDPLRLRLIEAFVYAPRTTMQVAELLGENPTKLYRHVDTLERAELLVLVEERKRRGTVERYLQAVAQRFEVDPMLFPPSERQTERERMIGALFNDVRQEFLDSTDPREVGGEGIVPLIARVSGRGSPEQVARLRQKLLEWLEECDGLEADEKGEAFGGLIAFYGRTPERRAVVDRQVSKIDRTSSSPMSRATAGGHFPARTCSSIIVRSFLIRWCVDRSICPWRTASFNSSSSSHTAAPPPVGCHRSRNRSRAAHVSPSSTGGVVRLVYHPVTVRSARWKRPMSCHRSGKTYQMIGAPGSRTTRPPTFSSGPP